MLQVIQKGTTNCCHNRRALVDLTVDASSVRDGNAVLYLHFTNGKLKLLKAEVVETKYPDVYL